MVDVFMESPGIWKYMHDAGATIHRKSTIYMKAKGPGQVTKLHTRLQCVRDAVSKS